MGQPQPRGGACTGPLKLHIPEDKNQTFSNLALLFSQPNTACYALKRA